MTYHTWDLMKLAFRYFARGFERIIFMILGAQIAFLLCYLFFCEILYTTTLPALPKGYTIGGETMAGAMLMAGVAAIICSIWTLLILAAAGMIVGYIRHYLAVLSYYDEEKYAWCRQFRAPKIPEWLMSFALGKEAEQIRLATIEECKAKIAEIKKR